MGDLVRFQYDGHGNTVNLEQHTFTPGTDAPPAPVIKPGGQGGVYSVIGRGPATLRTIEQYKAADVIADGSGIFQTLRNQFGSPVSLGNMKPNDLITIDGCECLVSSAIADGQIVRNPDGTYSEGQAWQAPQPPTVEAPAITSIGEDEERLLEMLSEGGVSMEANACIVEALSGEIQPGSIARLATRMQAEPYRVSCDVKRITEAFQAQADQTIQNMGIDPESLFDWARDNRPSELREAMKKHTLGRSTDGYSELAEAWLLSLPQTDPDTILNAQLGEGITARRTDAGKIILTTPTGEMEWGAAYRAGLLNIGPRRGD